MISSSSVPMTRALVRGVSLSFEHAVVAEAPASPIDVSVAIWQHRAYVDALRETGLEIVELPALPEHPDACFVEDCAVVGAGVALINRMGAPSRRGEEVAVRQALERSHRIEVMEAPATLDGGDCLRVENRILVGLSRRTNAQGLERLREVFEPLGFQVIGVPVESGLHLKCACSYLGRGHVLLVEDTLPPSIFGDLDVVRVPSEEAPACNCVAFGDRVVMPAGFPRTRQAVARLGFEPIEVETSEIRKADGLLTCMSILHQVP